MGQHPPFRSVDVSELPARMTQLLIVWAMFFLPGPVAVTVRPSFAIAPGSFQATIIIERDERNRQLEYGYQKGEFIEVSSRLSLDGAQSQRVWQPKPWERVPGGDYIAYASLTRIDRGRSQVIRVEQPFRSVFPDDF